MSKLIDHLDISMELWLQVIYNPITAMGFQGNVYLLHCRKKIGDVGGFQLVDCGLKIWVHCNNRASVLLGRR